MTLCKRCGERISWMQKSGSPVPVEPGTRKPHWKRCKAVRASKRTPEVSEGRLIVGPLYRPSCGQCSIAPWEACACSHLLSDRPDVTAAVNAELDERLYLLLWQEAA
jgi:hypothetical protein